MASPSGDLPAAVEQRLWPAVERLLQTRPIAGLAVGIVRGHDVVQRGFGVRDLRTGQAVTPETVFHLASVSKPFVATAVVLLASGSSGRTPRLDLDAPITDWIPEFTLADGRQGEVTARWLLSHTSGLPDVSEYGWHEPQLGDDALSEFARGRAHWTLQSEPGTTFFYSNSGYELLGLLLSRITGETFESAMREQLLAPLGMNDSTFLRADVSPQLAASPHVALPLQVPGDAYPYTRRHAPSSSLHSNVTDLTRWITAQVAVSDDDGATMLDPRLLASMREPVASVDEPPWEEEWGLGWALGHDLGHRTVAHSGADPGFGSRLVLVPDARVGVVVLANSNTVPTSAIVEAALELVLGAHDAGLDSAMAALETLPPPVVTPVAEVLALSGADAAAQTYAQLASADPAQFDLDDEGFENAVWGAIELHRTTLVWPLLVLWTRVRPESSQAWTMSGWAHQVDGDLDAARRELTHALTLDPDNADAALIMGNLPAT